MCGWMSGKLVKTRSDRGRDAQKVKGNKKEAEKNWRVKHGWAAPLRYFQAPDKTPAPALPKDYIDRSPRRSIDNRDTSSIISFLASRPLMSPAPTAVRQSGLPRTLLSDGQMVGPSSSSGRRSSTTTGSSSSHQTLHPRTSFVQLTQREPLSLTPSSFERGVIGGQSANDILMIKGLLSPPVHILDLSSLSCS